MKQNILSLAFVMLAACTAFVSCEDPVLPEEDDRKEEIVFPEAVTVPLEADGTYAFEFTPAVDWSVKLEYPAESVGWFWIQEGNSKVYNMRGKGGQKASVTVCAGSDEDFDTMHSCTLVLKMGDKEQTVATFTRGTLVREFGLSYCKMDGEYDYASNTDEGSEMMYDYEDPLSGDNKVIPLVMLSGSKVFGFRRSILITANFDWRLKDKSDNLSDLAVPEGTAGSFVEMELEANPLKYPLEDKEVEISFCPKDNPEAVYAYKVLIPGCGNVFSFTGLDKESSVDGKGRFMRETSMGSTWADSVDVTILGREGVKVYAFGLEKNVDGEGGRWEKADWINLNLAEWNPEAGVVQELNLGMTVDVNEGEIREGYVFAMPADAAPSEGQEGQIFGSDLKVLEEYSQYVVTHITQSERVASIYPMDVLGMEDAGASFSEDKESSLIGQFGGVSEAYTLTYTNQYSRDGSILVASEEYAVTGFEFYDINMESMAEESSWLSVQTLYDSEKGAFRIEMETSEDNMEGYVVLLCEDGPFAVIVCKYDEEEKKEAVTGESVKFRYADMGYPLEEDATLVHVTEENLAEMNMKHAKYEITFDESIYSGETYILTCYSRNQSMSQLSVEGYDPMVHYMSYTPTKQWMHCEPQIEELNFSIVRMPKAGEQQYGHAQVAIGTKMIFIYYILEIE